MSKYPRMFELRSGKRERQMIVEEFDDTIGKLPRSGNRCSRQLSVRLYTSESLEPQISGEAGRHSRAIALSVTTAYNAPFRNLKWWCDMLFPCKISDFLRSCLRRSHYMHLNLVLNVVEKSSNFSFFFRRRANNRRSFYLGTCIKCS